MRYFHYKTLNELETEAAQLGCANVRFEANPQRIQEILARPVQVGRQRAGNSLCIHPMEGCDGELDGTPGELTVRRYIRFAEGGAKLLWFEATAVRQDGRANTRQLWITRENLGAYRSLLSEIHARHKAIYGSSDDLIIPIQLTHSGRYSVPTKTIAYHNPLIDEKSKTPADYPVISDDELERLEDDFVAAAGLAKEAGFTAIDMKVTHGYLLSELMGAKLREGRYGGPIENRTRFAVNVLGKIKAKYGNHFLLGMRLGCFDGVPYVADASNGMKGVPLPYETPYPYGFGVNPNDPLQEDLADVKAAIQIYKNAGIELLNVSLGCPYYNPHIGRPFEKPDDGNYEMPEHPLLGVERHFRIAGELQQSFPDLPMVGTGYSWLQIYAPHAAAANVDSGRIAFFGYGRGALAYPHFAKDILEKGELDPRQVCRTVTFCTFLMRQKHNEYGQFPSGCPPYDKEVYGPIIKEARELLRIQPAKA
jgi:2,4-dienoyl-CoA reductase-like NADH-dependent reductase (Old Yellow Enzyme family)